MASSPAGRRECCAIARLMRRLLLIFQAPFLADLQLGYVSVTLLRAHNIVLLVWVLPYALLCISTLVGAAVPSKWLANRELAVANLASDSSGNDKPANYEPNKWVTATLSFLAPPLGMLNVAQPILAAVHAIRLIQRN